MQHGSIPVTGRNAATAGMVAHMETRTSPPPAAPSRRALTVPHKALAAGFAIMSVATIFTSGFGAAFPYAAMSSLTVIAPRGHSD